MHPLCAAVLFLAGMLALATATDTGASLQLYLLNQSTYPGAVCLDGSPAGYYFIPSATGSLDIQFYFEGGGWCYNLQDCLARSKTQLGSSTAWPSTLGDQGGMVSQDCTVNPQFCDYNLVFLPYCDGNSFTGNRDEPINVDGTELYFRGRWILDAVMADLAVNPVTKKAWLGADNFMVTGCSAGGLASYLNGDYVLNSIPSKPTRYGIVPISGFFLYSDNLDLQPAYIDEMKMASSMANNSGTLPAGCVDRWGRFGLSHMCNFAGWVYPFIEHDIFIFNSFVDLWQIECIWTAAMDPANNTANGVCGALWAGHPCGSWSNSSLASCNSTQLHELAEFGAFFYLDLNTGIAGNRNRDNNGGFISSCVTHCDAQLSTCFQNFNINGVTPSQALIAWWNHSPSVSKWTHDCFDFEAAPGTPQVCNPSCVAAC